MKKAMIHCFTLRVVGARAALCISYLGKFAGLWVEPKEQRLTAFIVTWGNVNPIE